MIQRAAKTVVFFALLPSALGAQAPSVLVAPYQPLPGSIVRVTLTEMTRRPDSIVAVRGSMAGEPLRFLAADWRTYRAIGAVPVEASDSISAWIFVERSSGSVDSTRVSITVPHTEVPTTEPTLAVDERFTRPLDAKTRARIARENERARQVGRRAHESLPMWTAPFLRPRESRVTSEFGTGRMFNGAVASRHLGVDYAGASGAAIYAANRGVVALVDTFFLAGRVVYLDHGGGVVTGYFHLSKPLVTRGDTVSRGQRIGLVGATGRVTGPHLHWSARYGVLAVNPVELLALDERWYGGAALRPPCSTAEAMAADDQSKLKTWTDLHAAFKQYGHCDDGAIGEGWSGFVVNTLGERWSELAVLSALVSGDPRFHAFVLKHINETSSEEELALVRANARERCPKDASDLCAEIAKVIESFGKPR